MILDPPAPPEEKHQRAEKGLKVVVLIDVALVNQLDVSKHLQEAGMFTLNQL